MKTDTVETLLQMPTAVAPARKGKDAQIIDAIPSMSLRDPREMERADLEAYLQSTEHFPTKASLLEFARRYNVPVNARTQREEIIRLCLRMIHDIPAGFAGLRAAERAPTIAPAPGVETRKVLADFFVGGKSDTREDGQSIKKITSGLLDGILHCHEAGVLLTHIRGADADLFLNALETCESPIETHVRFLSNVVDFARLEANKYEFTRTPFRLRDCIGDALKRLALSAHQKNLELCYAVQPEAPERVVGDPARLQQILVNLVDNAIKFTEQGEIVVEVESPHTAPQTCDLRPATCDLLFSVRDTGVGMAPEQLRALTQLFSSGNRNDTPPLRGLGLAISHRLVELMGGHMAIASEVNGGSVCSFSIRLDGDKAAAGDSSPHLNTLQEQRILVVDDNTTHRHILRDLLFAWGAQPELAASGREALSLLYKQTEQDSFAAIIIDGHLPDMEGFASIRRQHLAEDPSLVGPMIMMLAAVDPKQEMARYRELNVAAFLQKPLTPAELLQALLEALVSGATSPTEEALDRTALWSLVAGDAKLLLELLVGFAHDCPRLLFALQHAILLEDRQAVTAATHALKGAILHFAARGVLRVLAVVESFGGQGDFVHAREIMTQLTVELSRLKIALDGLRQELADGHGR